MIFIRSLLFYILLTVITTFFGVIGLPLALINKKALIKLCKLWGRIIIVLLKAICRLEIEVRGREFTPIEPLIIASKHQSSIETALLWTLFNNPAFIMKKEALWVPVFGLYCRILDMIPIDRGAKIASIKKVIRDAEVVLRQGRSIVIFPEGTRAKVGDAIKIQSGVKAIHCAVPSVPVVPVALNSGLFLPKGKFNILPGVLIVQFLPIMPAVADEEFLPLLHSTINTACNKL